MKKYIIATISLILLSSACSSQPDHQSQPSPGPSPAPSGPMMLKGTVSMILNFLAPSAYAMAPALYGSVGSTVSLPYNTAEIGCQAARCAFLVDTGARDSTSVAGQQPIQSSAPPFTSTDPTSTPAPFNKGNGMTLQSSPVVDGKYSFTFTADSPVLEAMAGVEAIDSERRSYHGGIFKVIVRGWDVNSQTPLERSSDDREIALSVKDLKQFVKHESEVQDVSIDLKTTLGSNKKVVGVKADPEYTDDESFVQSLTTLFFDGLHAIDLNTIFTTLILDNKRNDSNFDDISNRSNKVNTSSTLQVKVASITASKALADLMETSPTFAADLQTEFTYIDSMIALAERSGQDLTSKIREDFLSLSGAYVNAALTLDSLNRENTSLMSDADKAARQLQIDSQNIILTNSQPIVAKGCAQSAELTDLSNSARNLQRAKYGVDFMSLVSSGFLSEQNSATLQGSVNNSYQYPSMPNTNWAACCMANGNDFNRCYD